MNGGFVRQEFHSSLALQAHPDLRFKPSTRVENACATGSAAIHMGLNTLAAGKARFVLVVGVEKMTELNSTQAGEVLIRRLLCEEANIEAGFAGIFGKITSAYFQRYGDKSDALPRSPSRRTRTAPRIRSRISKRSSPTSFAALPRTELFVAGPLKRTDCSPVTDGAAAGSHRCRTALGMKQAIAFRAAQHVNDLPMSKRDIIKFEGSGGRLEQGWLEAKLDLLDLSFVESHDCFTSAELIEYEAMGLTAPGEGERAIHEGWVERDGKLPVNVSGGLKAKGHPVGATGVSMHVMSAMQLTGTAPGPRTPQDQGRRRVQHGGAAAANYVSILEPLR